MGPASAPSVDIVKRKHRKIGVPSPSYLVALGLLLLALPSSQPAHALDAISLAGVNKAFETAAPAKTTRIGVQGDAAMAALREFVQGLSSNQADKADDYAGLRAYAAGLGSDQARRSDEIQVAANAAPKNRGEGREGDAGGRRDDRRQQGLPRLPRQPGGRLQRNHHGPHPEEDPGQVRVRELPRSGLAARQGGRRTRRRRHHLVPSGRPQPQRRGEQRDLPRLPHKGDRTYWDGSTHETRGLQCSNCHTVMRNVSLKYNTKTAWEPETCFQCHKDRRAQLYRSSHMPIREGKMVCSDCHNPHGSFTEALLRENSINDNCYKCHAEKRGPFLFEHLPVRENCANCHEAHGSMNQKLLKTSLPRLCGGCHTFDHGPAIAGGPGNVQNFGRACLNCHTEIHGTNSPSGALLLR